jgi:hypothetical protein
VSQGTGSSSRSEKRKYELHRFIFHDSGLRRRYISSRLFDPEGCSESDGGFSPTKCPGDEWSQDSSGAWAFAPGFFTKNNETERL